MMIYVCTTYAHLAFEDREKAVALAVKMNARADGSRGRSNETKLKQARKRYDEVTRLFDRLYEDALQEVKDSQSNAVQWAELINDLEWTGWLNNIRACVREIVNEEIIYT